MAWGMPLKICPLYSLKLEQPIRVTIFRPRLRLIMTHSLIPDEHGPFPLRSSTEQKFEESRDFFVASLSMPNIGVSLFSISAYILAPMQLALPISFTAMSGNH